MKLILQKPEGWGYCKMKIAYSYNFDRCD